MLFKKIFSKKFRIHCFLIYFWNIMELPIGREWSGGISIHENKERYKEIRKDTVHVLLFFL